MTVVGPWEFSTCCYLFTRSLVRCSKFEYTIIVELGAKQPPSKPCIGRNSKTIIHEMPMTRNPFEPTKMSWDVGSVGLIIYSMGHPKKKWLRAYRIQLRLLYPQQFTGLMNIVSIGLMLSPLWTFFGPWLMYHRSSWGYLRHISNPFTPTESHFIRRVVVTITWPNQLQLCRWFGSKRRSFQRWFSEKC